MELGRTWETKLDGNKSCGVVCFRQQSQHNIFYVSWQGKLTWHHRTIFAPHGITTLMKLSRKPNCLWLLVDKAKIYWLDHTLWLLLCTSLQSWCLFAFSNSYWSLLLLLLLHIPLFLLFTTSYYRPSYSAYYYCFVYHYRTPHQGSPVVSKSTNASSTKFLYHRQYPRQIEWYCLVCLQLWHRSIDHRFAKWKQSRVF